MSGKSKKEAGTLKTNKLMLDKIAKIFTTFGKVYNDFESVGSENIPSKGPALVVFYHGLMPLDAWFFGLQHYLNTGRLIRGLGDRWLFKAPGMKQLVEAVGAVPGDFNTALKMLQEGELVGVSPGGTREAISGTSNNYKLIWKNRTGFAKLALEAKVDIIPGFTKNIEELYRAPFVENSFFQKLYERTRLPLVPIVGLGPLPFPVKLTTILGAPIKYDSSHTPETLTKATQEAIRALIAEHQPRHQTIVNAIKERL